MLSDRLSIVIVDDEPSSCETLKGLLALSEFPHEVLGVANTKVQALELVAALKPDMIFLDIELIEATGFDIIQGLGDECPPVVFTTAHNHYAVDAFRVGACDFLLKPLTLDQLQLALQRVQERLRSASTTLAKPAQPTSDKIVIKSTNRVDYVSPADINYIEVDGSYCTFFLVNGHKVVATAALKEFEEVLSANTFCRVNHSVLLNLDQISAYKRFADKCTVVLKNAEKISVSRRRRNQFLDALIARYGDSKVGA